MKFNLSINISQGVSDNFNYIVTPNAQKVYGNIVDSFQSGIHSFLIIGTYGTGKSSFLMALEQDLLNNKSKLVSERSVFADAKSFEFMNIVGDYSSLSTLLSKELSIAPSDDSKNVFSTLTRYLIKLKDQNKFLFIFIDEFGINNVVLGGILFTVLSIGFFFAGIKKSSKEKMLKVNKAV